jgi:hypothetical protein
MEQQIYNVITTLLFIFFAIVWKTDNWLNITIKIVITLLAIAGLFINLHYFGFIIQIR